MREYIYLFVNNFVWQGKDSNGKDRYLFENVGIPLSSKHKVICDIKEKKIKLTIKNIEDNCENHNYFSKHISDLVAIVGNNGSGKTCLLRLLMWILTPGTQLISTEKRAGELEYVLVFADDKQVKFWSTFKENNVEVIGGNKDRNYTSDYVIFYSPIYNVVNGFGANILGSSDISTESIISIYSNRLHNLGMENQRFFDRLDSYSLYEQYIEMKFVADFLQEKDELPMALPKYVCVEANYDLVQALKNELKAKIERPVNDKEREEKHYREKLLQIIKINETKKNKKKAKERLTHEVFLSVFSCLCRTRYDIIFKVIKEFTDDITMEEALVKMAEYLPTTNIDIVKLQDLVDTIWSVSTATNDETRLIYIENNIDKIKSIMEQHITIKNQYLLLVPFLLFKRQRLSTGEDNFIQFFARFYNIWIDTKDDQLLSIAESNRIVFIIDEGEANFHPEWQRIYMKTLVNWIEIIMKKLKDDRKITNIPQFQIILSTHSPFVACDLPSNNMVRLKISDGNKTVEVKSSDNDVVGIGTAITDLLKSDFFIKNTLGALAEEKIEKLIREKRKGNLSPESQFVLKNLGDKFFKDFIGEE